MADTTTTQSRAIAEIKQLIDAGRPLIYILSPEEARVAQILSDASQQLFEKPIPVFTWSLTEGLRSSNGTPPAIDGSARAALDFASSYDQPAIFHLEDFHEPMRQTPDVRRRLRDLYASCLDKQKFIFISSPVVFIPEELNREIVLIELPLPDHAELLTFLERESVALAKTGGSMDTDPGTMNQLASTLRGLTFNESSHALRRASSVNRRIDSSSVRYLLEEKHLLVKKKTGVIEYYPFTIELDEIGGVSTMKKWLLERRRLFEMRDEVSADIVPKGLLLMGISGCGKSLAIKAIASCFQLPLYRIDMIEIFSGRHGNPEGAFVSACRTMEELSPAIVWFDEIEMGITAKSDDAAGTLGRIFAFFLTWMQEKTRGLFVAATANRIDLLPAEMIRKGRFDEVFFVDLPGEEDRVDIVRIHLQKRGIDPAPLQIERLKQFTRGWTGAEIEQLVVSAITQAKLHDRAITGDDLLNLTANIVPLSKTMKEQVEHIRSWALDRAIRAAPRANERG